MTSSQLDSKINSLDQRVGAWFTTKDGAFWNETWALVKGINDSFKEVRYPTVAEKQEAWQRFQKVIEKIKAEQERQFAERQGRSGALTREIIGKGERAWPWHGGFADAMWLVLGPGIAEKLVEGAFYVVERMLGIEDKRTPLQKRRDELKEKSQLIKETWEYFTHQKGNLLREDKDKCFKALQIIETELDKAWGQWKQENDQDYGNRQQLHAQREAVFERKRTEKRALISTAESLSPDERADVERAKGLMGEWKSIGFAGKNHEEALWESFQRALDHFWERRKRGVLNKQVDRKEWLEESIEHDEGVLDKARADRESAWSDSFREKMDDKISSLETKIERKRESLKETKRRIDELRDGR